MKKFFSALASLILVVVLAGCGARGKAEVLETTQFSLTQPGIEVLITYHHRKDKVLRQESHSEIELTAYQEAGIDDIPELYETVAADYLAVKGVSYDYKIGDKTAVEDVEINYEVADIEAVSKLIGSEIDSQSESDKIQWISMKKSAEMLLDQGYKKVDKK